MSPHLVGDGPATCSTSLVLTRSPEVIFDVNGYYRDLGVDPRAARGAVSRAYQARGLDDPHLTFVVKQLLNPATRRAYDLTPLGSIFLDAEIRARIRRFRAHSRAVAGIPVKTVEETAVNRPCDTPDHTVIDTGRPARQDSPSTSDWPYSHYLWKSDQTDAKRLRRWQEDLTVALGRVGVSMQIAVGSSGGPGPEVEVRQVGSRTVIFLHENHRSTDVLVQRVVSSLHPETQKREQKMSVVTFRKGAEAAQEASKGGGQFAKTHYFGLNGEPSSPDNTAILRFLTDKDAWIVVDQHMNIRTKPAPADYSKDSRWPERMGSVCRADIAFKGVYDDCFICTHLVDGKAVKRPGARSWALACLREEVIEDGQVVGIRDKVREVIKTDKTGKSTGETIQEKAIVVVNMGFKNFFGILQGFAGHYGTVLDRDYLVRRSGTDETTTYSLIPLDPIVVDDQGTKFDLRLPQFADRYQPNETLDQIVTDKSSDDFYARFFDTRVEAPARAQSGSRDGSATPTPERSSNDADTDRLAALALRVKDYGKTGATSAPKVPTPIAAGDAADRTSDTAEPAPVPPKAKAAAGMRNFE